MAAVANNNAFGPGAVSWNIGFPEGNITAPEMIAYIPHNLKGIDWIDRLISHGARASHISAMINEFRILPDNRVHMPNSTLVMISYAMRRAGKPGWTISSHMTTWATEVRAEDDLNVATFRTPRETHPKTMKGTLPEQLAYNQKAHPVQFKDLARGIKKHPSGPDALDLTRCVLYAVEHPHEDWKYPDDFKKLVDHLGGPAIITYAHHDRQAFARRDHVKFPASKTTTTKLKRKSGSNSKDNKTTTLSQKPKARSAGQRDSESKQCNCLVTNKKANLAEESELERKKDDESSGPPIKKSKRSKSHTIVKSESTETSKNILARDMNERGHKELFNGDISRRSHAWRARAANISIDDDDEEAYYNPCFGYKPAYNSNTRPVDDLSKYIYGSKTPPQKLILEPRQNVCQPNSRSYLGVLPLKSASHNAIQQFSFQSNNDANLENLQDHDASELFGLQRLEVSQQFYSSPTPARRQPLLTTVAQTFGPPRPYPPDEDTTYLTDKDFQAVKRYQAEHNPIELPAPILNYDRPRIDINNVHLYTRTGLHSYVDMYLSAHDYMRFGGPRLSAPFRDLHQLVFLDDTDTSDWAENIRWAKEQYVEFGHVWSEEEMSLNMITEHRLRVTWQSDEAKAAFSASEKQMIACVKLWS